MPFTIAFTILPEILTVSFYLRFYAKYGYMARDLFAVGLPSQFGKLLHNAHKKEALSEGL